MFTIEAVIESQINVVALARCTDMSEADAKSSQPAGKLSVLAASMFGLDASAHWQYTTFFVKLPTEILEVINASGLKANTIDNRSIGEGFLTGSLYDYTMFIVNCCREGVDTKLRFVANQLFSYFKDRSKLLKNADIKMQPDKTFTIKI